MDWDSLVKQIKNHNSDYKLMIGGNITPNQAYNVGELVAKDVGMTPQLNLHALIQANGGKIHYINYTQFKSFLDDGINIFENSIFVHGTNDFDIILPAYAPLVEQRYTIAHELGHYALHSIHAGKCYALRQGNDIAEKEADCFALGFLLPSDTFKNAYQRLNKNIGKLSIMFLVPYDIIEARIRSLKLS
jgi:hypothetical protein